MRLFACHLLHDLNLIVDLLLGFTLPLWIYRAGRDWSQLLALKRAPGQSHTEFRSFVGPKARNLLVSPGFPRISALLDPGLVSTDRSTLALSMFSCFGQAYAWMRIDSELDSNAPFAHPCRTKAQRELKFPRL